MIKFLKTTSLFVLMDKIEEKIGKYTSREALKIGKSLYDSGAVIYSFSEKTGTNLFSVKDSQDCLHRFSIKSIDSFIEEHKEKGITAVDVAALYHYYSFYFSCYKNSEEKLLNYKKNLQNNSTEVIKDENTHPRAKLILKSNKYLPNSSSTWESCSISIEIIFNNKVYIGNPNKLRQLRFDESKTGTIKLTDFSYQSRQIIRFLSQYAEPDGSGFSLRSEIMAEFLHSLHSFPEFYFGKEQIIIHKKSAEVIGVYSKTSTSSIIKPALQIGTQIIILNKHHLVVGKSGIWVGILGEYWWVPAVYDILWLRKFLISDFLNKLPTANFKNFPIKVIDEDSVLNLNEKKCTSHYYINLSDKNELELELKYFYNNSEFPISNNRLAWDEKNIWKRDKVYEECLKNELFKLGFSLSDEKSFVHRDIEGVGFFLDKVLSKWIEEDRRIFILPKAVRVCSKILPLMICCSNIIETSSLTKLEYELTTGNGKIGWRELLKNIKNNRQYVVLDNGTIGFVSEGLSKFLDLFKSVAKVLKNPDRIQLPKSSILFWVKHGFPYFKNLPKEWVKFLEAENKTYSKSRSCSSLMNSFKGELRIYQKEAVDWMKRMISNDFNIILADEMGLGKTVQSLAFMQYYRHKVSKTLPCIVVCPTSLVENWKEEARKFVPELKAIVIAGINREDSIKNLKKFDLVITSYALIKRDIEKYTKIKFGLLVLDEAQHIKNPATINAKVCKSIISKHRLVLTGTPLENSPEDIWSIFDFLNPGMLGSRDNFKSYYSKIEYNIEKQKELADRIAPFILRRHKTEVEQLPEKTEQTLFCEMIPSQRKLYNSLLIDGKNRYQSFYDGKTTRFDILSSLLRLRQLCCHPNLLPDTLRQGVIDSAKTELLKELLLEVIDSGHRTLVFSQFTSLLAILKEWLNENKILFEYLDGSTKNRYEKVERFNNDKKISIFLLSLKAGGTGLNLTGADTVIIYDPWWNPSVEAQATDRTHRIGQKNRITSIKLVVRDSIEEKILELQSRKQGLFNGIVENSSSFKKLTDKDIAYLLN